MAENTVELEPILTSTEIKAVKRISAISNPTGEVCWLCESQNSCCGPGGCLRPKYAGILSLIR